MSTALPQHTAAQGTTKPTLLRDVKDAPVRSLSPLHDAGIAPTITPELEQVASQFAVSITPAMMALIDKDDAADPIAAQFVPSAKELQTHPAERADPIGDDAYSPVEGIVHRYPDRVLLKPLHLCPVYCRFCFRKEQIGETGSMLSPAALTAAIDYIRDHSEIWEVILSGGDPLMLSDQRLQDIMQRLNDIVHVKVIRFHSRVPVVDPARITPKLAHILRGRAATYIFLHSNHPRELTAEAIAACAHLIDAGIPMLSQSVLLRGVNDDHKTLAQLMRGFVEARIKPHYLHHPDMVRGTGHFRVAIAEGQELVRGLRGKLSGLCQPTYMLDIPGGYGKVPLGPSFIEQEDGAWRVTNHRGESHIYTEPDINNSNGRDS